MEHLPIYISLVFGLIVLLTLAIFYRSSNNSKPFLLISLFWIIVQSILSLKGFYTISNTRPPRLLLLIAPPILFIAATFISKRGKEFIDRLDIKTLTILHTIRIPVELVLFWLAENKVIPTLMTFEGWNFDILSGLSAPIIYYFGFKRKNLSPLIILIWNVICLGLLLNIVFIALESAPTYFQRFAFEQPNIAIGYFPFVFLPSFIVPIVLFSHIVSIKQLLQKNN